MLSKVISVFLPYINDDNFSFVADFYVLIIKPIKNHIFRAFLFGICIILLVKVLEYYNGEPNIFAIIMALISMIIVMPIVEDLMFYSAYVNAIINLEKLVYYNDKIDEKSIRKCNNYLDQLQYNLHFLRNILKKRIKKANSAFLTYDEEIKQTMTEIDVFSKL